MAGYTTITVKGQEIGLRFGLPAIKRIADKINLLSGAEEITLNLMSMVHIIYAGYQNDCIANDREAKIEFSDFYSLVEDAAIANDLSEVKRVIEVFAGSKDVSEKPQEEGVEKKSQKSIGKKLKSSVPARTGTSTALAGESTSYSLGRMTKTG